MSSCARYIPNTRNCEEIPGGYDTVGNFIQTLKNGTTVVTKQFALVPDNTYYPLKDGTWSSCDPRLVDQMRGMKVSLSKPPLTTGIDCELKKVGYNGSVNVYDTLQDINIGDTVYYYDRDLAQPFIPTNFSIPTDIEKQIFIDPMTSVKPQYNRKKIVYSVGCNQPTRDQLTFREDMMERFLRKENQRNWEAFQASK